jgi:hypothetical protein
MKACEQQASTSEEAALELPRYGSMPLGVIDSCQMFSADDKWR